MERTDGYRDVGGMIPTLIAVADYIIHRPFKMLCSR